jgi:hypothetical protein
LAERLCESCRRQSDSHKFAHAAICWAKANGKDSHSEAIRHLLELGLTAPKQKVSN